MTRKRLLESVRNVRKKTYNIDVMKTAMKAIYNSIKIAQAARDHNIPRKTLFDHVKRNEVADGNVVVNIKAYGEHLIVFTKQQEEKPEERIIYITDREFPMTVKNLQEKEYLFAVELKKNNRLGNIQNSWRKNKMAGKEWYLPFRKRHPILSLGKAEGLSCNRAQAFNETRINSCFDIITKLINSKSDPR